MNGGLHPRADVDTEDLRSPSPGWGGFLSVEDVVTVERAPLYHYLESHPDALIKQVFSSGIVRTPDDVYIGPETFKDHLNTSHFQNWKGKPSHG